MKKELVSQVSISMCTKQTRKMEKGINRTAQEKTI